MATETVSISIGSGPNGPQQLLLPRGHALVQHLEALLPAPAAHKPPAAPLAFAQDATRVDAAISALAALAQQQQQQQQQPRLRALPTLPSLSTLPRHVYQSAHSPVPRSFPSLPSPGSLVSSLPVSPYHSDTSSTVSSSSSASSATTVRVQSQVAHEPKKAVNSAHANVTNKATGVRRRRAGQAATTSGKKCQMPDCDKISVSRGLCRGHGGGRRCRFEGCSKGAQSRSDFCWAHGGGQRCEVPECMRSRKSKRFCVAHLGWESAPGGATSPSSVTTPPTFPAPRTLSNPHQSELMHRPLAPRPIASSASLPGLARLPSLEQALKKHQVLGASPMGTPN